MVAYTDDFSAVGSISSLKSSVIRQKGVSRKQSTPKFPKNKHCLTPDKHTYVYYSEFIPTITGEIIITENERKLLPFGPRLGGLGIPIFEELREIKYQNSIMISDHEK